MKIGAREIGPGSPPYVIAEIGVNHDGSAARAVELVDVAADAGADAVKFQLFEAERLMSRASRLAKYQASAGERDPVEMLRRLELSVDAMAPAVARAHARGVHAIVTVFSLELVDHAERLPWDAYKTASPDIVHRPLLERLMRTGKPMIVSTGASDHDEVRRAVEWIAPARGRLALLQCVSSYPAREQDAALGAIATLTRGAELPVGYSDHTAGIETGAIAVACGAVILEKHLTYDRGAKGPDHAASLDGPAMREYVMRAREAISAPPRVPEMMLGSGAKVVQPCEEDVRGVSRQSVVSARAVGAGETIVRDAITFKRPGTGIAPWRLDEVVGRIAARNIEADTPIAPEDLR